MSVMTRINRTAAAGLIAATVTATATATAFAAGHPYEGWDGAGSPPFDTRIVVTDPAPIRAAAREAAIAAMGAPGVVQSGYDVFPEGHRYVRKDGRWIHADAIPHDAPRPTDRNPAYAAEFYGTAP